MKKSLRKKLCLFLFTKTEVKKGLLAHFHFFQITPSWQKLGRFAPLIYKKECGILFSMQKAHKRTGVIKKINIFTYFTHPTDYIKRYDRFTRQRKLVDMEH